MAFPFSHLLGRRPAGNFVKKYQCLSVHFMEKGRDTLDSINEGGKIFLPPDALEEISRMSVEYPLTFAVSNPATQRTTHCGVLEFTAPHRTAYLPYWMMKNLLLNEGDEIIVAYAQLPLGTFAKLRPLTPDFLELDNPRIVLERALRKFACLTRGDTIAITFGSHVYELGVVELKPSNGVSIIECDLQLDFDTPEGFLPPKPAPKAVPAPVIPELVAPPIEESPATFHGVGHSLRRKKSEPLSSPSRPPTAPTAGAAPSASAAAAALIPGIAAVPRGALPFVFGVLNFPRPAPTASPAEAAAAVAPSDPFRGEGMSLKSK